MNRSRPDGFYGSMLASESLTDGMTILHGPGGCRGYAASLSSRYVPREFKTVEGDFFFHRSRVPCTFVDRDDYIYGASKKVSMILDILKSEDTKFAVVLESPGASLIGDKLQDEVISSGMSDKTAILGKCLMSESFGEGYDKTLCLIARKLTKKSEKRPMTVNLTGLPFISKGCFCLVKELHALLAAMGIEVIADIGISCSVEQMRESSQASANVCICPEYFSECGDYYEKELGIPTVRGPLGAPVGYDAIRAWVRAIAETLSCDPSPALKIIDDEEKEVFRYVSASLSIGEFVSYRTFSVLSEPSVALPLMTFIVKRLHLVPASIELCEHDADYEGQLESLLKKMGEEDVLKKEFGTEFSEVLFGPGSMCDYLLQKEMCSTAVDISIPSKDYMDIAPKSIMGLDGCRRIVEKILNTR